MTHQREFTLPYNEAIGLIESEGGIGIWSWHLQSAHLEWSPGMFAIFGVEPGSVEPTIQYMRDRLLAEDREKFADAAVATISHTMSERRVRIVHPDGSLRWLRCCSRLVNGEDGTPSHMYGVVFDVTETRRALDTERQNAGLIDAIGSLFDLLVWVARPDGSLVERIGGTDTVPDWDGVTQIHPDDRYGVELAWADAVADGKRYSASFRVRGQAGDYFPITSRATPFEDADGNVRGWIGFSTRHFAQDEGGPTDTALAMATPLTSAQVRAARGYLGWTAHDLAVKADVSFSTVRRIETPGARNVREQSLLAIRQAFEKAGIRFVSNSDGSTGMNFS